MEGVYKGDKEVGYFSLREKCNWGECKWLWLLSMEVAVAKGQLTTILKAAEGRIGLKGRRQFASARRYITTPMELAVKGKSYHHIQIAKWH